jgi:hypothetical protein
MIHEPANVCMLMNALLKSSFTYEDSVLTRKTGRLLSKGYMLAYMRYIMTMLYCQIWPSRLNIIEYHQ